MQALSKVLPQPQLYTDIVRPLFTSKSNHARSGQPAELAQYLDALHRYKCTVFSPDSEDVHGLGPVQSLVWGGGLSLCLKGGGVVRLAVVQQWSGFCLHSARSAQTLKG